MLIKVLLLHIIFEFFIILTETKEAEYIINSKEIINEVSDKYLSFSVDATDILRAIRESPERTILAKYFSPSFIRISGPSTDLLQISGNKEIAGADGVLSLTPQIWKSLNHWIRNSNLTPIFAVAGSNKINEIENQKRFIPFLNINYQMGFESYWQLLYDCRSREFTRYVDDLKDMKHILDKYPSTKLIASNVGSCMTTFNQGIAQKDLENLQDIVDVVLWDPFSMKKGAFLPSQSFIAESNFSVWLAMPKVNHIITFERALLWAKVIGEAAKEGYKVVFKQLLSNEFFTDTPVFWVSLLHKAVMGRTVLDAAIDSFPVAGTYVYTHCTKKQSRYAKPGGLTVFVVNTGNQDFVASIRIASNGPRSIDIQTFILNSNKSDFRSTYLNGEKLTMDLLESGRLLHLSKLGQQTVDKFLKLHVPAKSVGYFILPGAKAPACMNKEKPKEKMAKLEIIFTEKPVKEHTSLNNTKRVELQLTDDEIKRILSDRAKMRAAEQNIDVSSAEFENIMAKAVHKWTKRESLPPNKKWRQKAEGRPMMRRLKNRKREKRDINLDLLRRNMQDNRLKGKNKPTLRNLDQNSLGSQRPSNMFTELASSWAREDLDNLHSKGFRDLDNNPRVGDATEMEDLHSGEKFVDERLRFLMEPDIAKDGKKGEDRITNYHTFYEHFDDSQYSPGSVLKLRKKSQNDDNDVKAFLTGSPHTGASELDTYAKLGSPPVEAFEAGFDWENINQPNVRIKRQLNTTNETQENSEGREFGQLDIVKQLQTVEEGIKRKNAFGGIRKNGEMKQRKIEKCDKVNDVENRIRKIEENKRIQEENKKAKEERKRKNGERMRKINEKNVKPKIKNTQSEQDMPSNGEHLRIVIGKPVDLNKITVNERRRENMAKFLKQRLENRKKLLEIARETKTQPNSSDDQVKSSRKKRRPDTSDLDVPKIRHFKGLLKRYKSNKKNMRQKKSWKPQDLGKIKRTPSYSVENLDDREFNQRRTPVFRKKFRGSGRDKRNVENLDVAINEIEDEPYGAALKPKVFKEYNSSFVTKGHADTNFTSLTTVVTEENTMTSNKPPEAITQGFKAVTVNSSIDYCTSNYTKTTLDVNVTSDSTQQIPKKTEDKESIIDKVVSFVAGFFENIYLKLASVMVG